MLLVHVVKTNSYDVRSHRSREGTRTTSVSLMEKSFVPGPLQACTSAHMSDDNPDVIRHVGRLLEAPSARMESRVERNTDDEMVRLGTVKQVDKDGGDRIDGAADQGGRRAGAHIMDVRRMCSQTRHFWYLVLNHLHGFFSSLLTVSSSMMITRREKALDPVAWSASSLPKKKNTHTRRLGILNGFLETGGYQGWPYQKVAQHDVAWPHSVGSLVEEVSSLRLRLLTLVKSGVLMLTSFSITNWELVKGFHLKSLCPSTERMGAFCVGCSRSSMLGAFVGLPGDLGRFMPNEQNHCRLFAASRPKETAAPEALWI